MAKMTEKQLAARDSKRDIGAELLEAVREMKAGKAARSHRVKVPEIVEANLALPIGEVAALAPVNARRLPEECSAGYRQ